MWEGYNREKIIGKLSELHPILAIEVFTDNYDAIIELSNIIGLDFTEAISNTLWIAEAERQACYDFFEEFTMTETFGPFLEDFVCYVAENGSVVTKSKKKESFGSIFLNDEYEIEEDEKRIW